MAFVRLSGAVFRVTAAVARPAVFQHAPMHIPRGSTASPGADSSEVLEDKSGLEVTCPFANPGGFVCFQSSLCKTEASLA